MNPNYIKVYKLLQKLHDDAKVSALYASATSVSSETSSFVSFGCAWNLYASPGGQNQIGHLIHEVN